MRRQGDAYGRVWVGQGVALAGGEASRQGGVQQAPPRRSKQKHTQRTVSERSRGVKEEEENHLRTKVFLL